MQRLLALCACLFTLAPRAQTGAVLRVESEPPGAGVVVDGIVQPRVVTPVTLSVAPGEHRIRVGLGGYVAFEETVAVSAGAPTVLMARLERLSGHLLVVLPPGATATVNGSPFSGSGSVPAGLADVAVTVPGELVLRQRVPVGPSASTEVGYTARRFRPVRAGLALLGPGVVQLADGRNAAGVVYGATVAGSLVTVALMSARAAQADVDNAAAQQQYESATTEAAAVAAREAIEREVGIVRSSRQIRGGAFVVGGIVYAISVIDAFARHVRRPGLTVTQRPPSPVSVRMTGQGAGLSLQF